MGKMKGAHSGKSIAASIIVAAILIMAAVLYVGGKTPSVSLQLGSQPGGSGGQQGGSQVGGFSAGTCPTNGQTTLTQDVRNGADFTADSRYDNTVYYFGNKGSFVTGTNTTGGTYTLNCGETYTMKLVSSDGNKKNNAYITSFDQGAGATLNADGTVTFTPSAAVYYLKAVASQHGVLQFRVFSQTNGAYRYLAGGASGNGNTQGFQLTGQIFNGTASENSTISVGSGASFADTIHFQTNETTTNFNDYGYYVAITAATAKWNVPSVKLNGVALNPVSLAVNPATQVSDEGRQFSTTYQYFYKVGPGLTNKVGGSGEQLLDVSFQALSGIDPAATDSPVVAFLGIGAYKSTTSNTINVAAAKDDSSATAVFTAQKLTLQIV